MFLGEKVTLVNLNKEDKEIKDTWKYSMLETAFTISLYFGSSTELEIVKIRGHLYGFAEIIRLKKSECPFYRQYKRR